MMTDDPEYVQGVLTVCEIAYIHHFCDGLMLYCASVLPGQQPGAWYYIFKLFFQRPESLFYLQVALLLASWINFPPSPALWDMAL